MVERVEAANCLSYPLAASSDGSLPCAVIEARKSSGACDCSAAARSTVPRSYVKAIQTIQTQADVQAQALDCLCEITETTGADLAVCISDASAAPMGQGKPVNGWCYVDPAEEEQANPAIVMACPPAEPWLLRFVGAGAPMAGADVFLACPSSDFSPPL